jgi:hypothetical protein
MRDLVDELEAGLIGDGVQMHHQVPELELEHECVCTYPYRR